MASDSTSIDDLPGGTASEQKNRVVLEKTEIVKSYKKSHNKTYERTTLISWAVSRHQWPPRSSRLDQNDRLGEI